MKKTNEQGIVGSYCCIAMKCRNGFQLVGKTWRNRNLNAQDLRTVNYNEDTNSEDEKDWILPEEETEKYQPFNSEVKNNHLFNYIF